MYKNLVSRTSSFNVNAKIAALLVLSCFFMTLITLNKEIHQNIPAFLSEKLEKFVTCGGYARMRTLTSSMGKYFFAQKEDDAFGSLQKNEFESTLQNERGRFIFKFVLKMITAYFAQNIYHQYLRPLMVPNADVFYLDILKEDFKGTLGFFLAIELARLYQGYMLIKHLKANPNLGFNDGGAFSTTAKGAAYMSVFFELALNCYFLNKYGLAVDSSALKHVLYACLISYELANQWKSFILLTLGPESVFIKLIKKLGAELLNMSLIISNVLWMNYDELKKSFNLPFNKKENDDDSAEKVNNLLPKPNRLTILAGFITGLVLIDMRFEGIIFSAKNGLLARATAYYQQMRAAAYNDAKEIASTAPEDVPVAVPKSRRRDTITRIAIALVIIAILISIGVYANELRKKRSK